MRLLDALSRRLQRRIDNGMESFEALVECQDHSLALSRAHIERVVVEHFAVAIERTEEATLASMLGTLCDLYALWRIESDRGWFLEQGYMSAATAKAIRKLVNKLCGKVRLQALPLVEAFGIPDALLGAPMLGAAIAQGGRDVHGR